MTYSSVIVLLMMMECTVTYALSSIFGHLYDCQYFASTKAATVSMLVRIPDEFLRINSLSWN